MIIETALIWDLEEILALQKLAYISEAELYNDFTIPPAILQLWHPSYEIRREEIRKL